MDIKTLNKIVEPIDTSLFQHLTLQEGSQQLLNASQSPAHFLTQLIEHEYYEDAVRFLAFGLPKREAIWWAYLCVSQTEAVSETEPALHAGNTLSVLLNTVKKWVYEPSEEARREVGALAEQLKMEKASCWAGMAVFWSGGSITAPDFPAVEPATHLTAVAVSGAVMLAVVSKEPEKAKQKYLHFLTQAVDIANGGNGSI